MHFFSLFSDSTEANVHLQMKLNAEFSLKMHVAVAVDELAVHNLYRKGIEMFFNVRTYCNKRNALV